MATDSEILVRVVDLNNAIIALKNELLGGAGEAYDSLGELAALLEQHADTATALASQIAEKSPIGHKHTVDDIEATGTRSASTYLNGSGGFSVPTNTTYSAITEAEATTGTATTARLVTAAGLKGAVQRWATGTYSTAISSIGQALNKAADAAAARTAIDAERAPWSGTRAAYDALGSYSSDRTYYITD